MPMVWNILGLLALKTKHNEHKKVCISQDSWLKQQRLTRFLKPEASLLQGSWGLTESTGSCNQAWRIGRNACGGRAERGVGSQPADTVHWDRPVLHLCNPSSRMRALVASIMGIWERGLQWEMGFRIRLLSKTYTMKIFFSWLWGGMYLLKRTPRVNRAQIHNQSLAAIVCRSLSHTVHVREKPQIDSSAFYTVILLPELNLIKQFLESYFNQWAETCPIQLELCTYVLFCIFTNQSEQFHNEETGCSILIIRSSAV